MLQTEARRVNMAPKDYQRLLDKANGGNAGAAEKLARLWYGEDNSKAAHWVEVAAKNGSQRAARLAKAVEHTPQELRAKGREGSDLPAVVRGERRRRAARPAHCS